MLRLPATSKDLLPPKDADLLTVGRNFFRAHYGEVKPLLDVLTREKPSVHGSFTLDEADSVFKIKEIAKENGFAVLSQIPTVKLRHLIREALKTTTGIKLKELQAQDIRLRIEAKAQAETEEAPAEEPAETETP